MYATLDDLLARFNRADHPELTQLVPDDGSDPPEPDGARLEQALHEASGQMDLYLGTRHSLPLAGLSPTERVELTRLCCDIARYRLWADRASAEVRQRYEDAIHFLEQAAAGRVRLGIEPPRRGRGEAVRHGPARRLTRETLDGLV